MKKRHKALAVTGVALTAIIASITVALLLLPPKYRARHDTARTTGERDAQAPSCIVEKIEAPPARVAKAKGVKDDLLVPTGIAFAVSVYLLIFGPDLRILHFGPASLSGPLSVTGVVIIYFIYTVSGVVLLHLMIFKREEELAKRGRHLSKKFPKYLEYFYTVIVSVSLAQIFLFTPRMADYVTWLQGDENYIGNQIKNVAQSYLKNECINRSTMVWNPRKWIEERRDATYFTDEYCAKLKKIIDARDVTEYVAKSVVDDPAFFDPIGELEGYDPDMPYLEPPDDEIRRLVNRFKVVHEYVSLKGESNSAGSNRLAWAGMLLLPIGIALRIVKTSVELRVPLE